MLHKYPALRAISSLYRAIAYVVALSGIAGVIIGFTFMTETSELGSILTIVTSIVIGLFGTISALAAAELINVVVDIEQNTRSKSHDNGESIKKTEQVAAEDGSIEYGGNKFIRLTKESGTAFCLGCRKVDAKAGMFYCAATDTFYHEKCMPAGN